MKKTIRILSYNIHKGFNTTNSNFSLKDIKTSIQNVHADLVCLQEVIGHHEDHLEHMNDWPNSSHFEYLADQTWGHFSYGKNAIYEEGHHGNAILSKNPIIFTENEDVSSSKFERRGLLHAEIHDGENTVHVFCVHLGLFEKDRKEQIKKLCYRINKLVPSKSPLIIAGDFNDWKKNVDHLLVKSLNMNEAFQTITGDYAKTFPSWIPFLSLDRIYYRNLKCLTIEILKNNLWRKQSDHLPILAEFEYLNESDS